MCLLNLQALYSVRFDQQVLASCYSLSRATANLLQPPGTGSSPGRPGSRPAHPSARHPLQASNTTTSTGRRSVGVWGCGVRGCGSADFKSLTRADKVDDHQLERRPLLARHPSGWNSVCSRSCHTGRHEGAMVAGGEAEVSMPMSWRVLSRLSATRTDQS